MIRFAAIALACCAAACSPQGGGAAIMSPPDEAARPVLDLPEIPPPNELQAAAPRALRIDIMGDAPHVIEGKVPNFVRVEGLAPAYWFYESLFPVRVETDGAVIAQTYAVALDDWSDGERFHPYRAMLAFDLAREMEAELVLEQDMHREDIAAAGAPPRSVRIPVVLAPIELAPIE